VAKGNLENLLEEAIPGKRGRKAKGKAKAVVGRLEKKTEMASVCSSFLRYIR